MLCPRRIQPPSRHEDFQLQVITVRVERAVFGVAASAQVASSARDAGLSLDPELVGGIGCGFAVGALLLANNLPHAARNSANNGRNRILNAPWTIESEVFRFF